MSFGAEIEGAGWVDSAWVESGLPTCWWNRAPAGLVTGYLHGDVPAADVVVDVREHLRDPHVDPAFRVLTGHDVAVVERVFATPGASGLIDGLVAVVTALLSTAGIAGRVARVAVGCSGGRHRSVVIADAVAARVALAGWGVEVEHLHVREAVADR